MPTKLERLVKRARRLARQCRRDADNIRICDQRDIDAAEARRAEANVLDELAAIALEARIACNYARIGSDEALTHIGETRQALQVIWNRLDAVVGDVD